MVELNELQVGMRLFRHYQDGHAMRTKQYIVVPIEKIFKVPEGSQDKFAAIEDTPMQECEYIALTADLNLEEWRIV